VRKTSPTSMRMRLTAPAPTRKLPSLKRVAEAAQQRAVINPAISPIFTYQYIPKADQVNTFKPCDYNPAAPD
jgi:hypothetical protein